jgi:tRNA-intron endonuclease
MAAYLKDDQVMVEDRNTASTLLNKGNFGTPRKGGGSVLNIVEAAYLLENDRLQVRRSRKGRPADLSFILKRGISKDDRFMENFLVFRDLRNRGLIVQGGDRGCFSTYPRGKRPGTGKADAWFRVYREDDRVTPREIWLESRKRHNMRMRSVAAVVDSDWDITYYLVRNSLEETPPNRSFDEGVATGLPSGTERVGIAHGGAFLHGGDTGNLHEKWFVGTRLGDGLLVSTDEDAVLSGKQDEGTGERMRIYNDLRGKGWFVRTGFKYGAHFRVYTDRGLDEHSQFLVHCVKEDETFSWEELSRPLRLSHSVRKRFLFGFHPTGVTQPHYKGEGPVYLEMEWYKP